MHTAKNSQVLEEQKTIQLFLVLGKKFTDIKNLNKDKAHVSSPHSPSLIQAESSEKRHSLHEPYPSVGTANMLTEGDGF